MDLARLNLEQKEVVRHRGHCLAVACPGAGKTTTLSYRAAYALAQNRRVAAVTFTRAAADELARRIIEIAPGADVANLLVGTFHSIDLQMCFPKRANRGFGRNILDDVHSPFKKNWVFASTGIRHSHIIRAIAESHAGIDLKSAIGIIEKAKERGSTDGLDSRLQAMVDIYRILMERDGYMDLQDIILKTNEALASGTLSPLAIDFLLVDEFQDTDQSQYEWVSLHGHAGAVITAVGDDDQSIYAFRRSLGYDVMARFVQEFKAECIALGTNYRCRTEILDRAGRLISKNTHRINKSLAAASGSGGTVSWQTFDSPASEAAAVRAEGEAALADNATVAVIARTHRELVPVQFALLEKNIAFRKAEDESIFDCAEVEVFAAALRSVIRAVPKDIDMVLGWAGMDEADTRAIRQLFGRSIRKGRLGDYKDTDITAKARDVWRRFAKLHEEWTLIAKKGRNEILVYSIHGWLTETLRKPHSRHIVDIAASLFRPPKDITLAEHLAFRKRQERQTKEESSKTGEMAPGVIHLITCHGAKGLEYDRVWIIGLNEGSFPSDDASLEEERRLMYVAMTRARTRLSVSAIAGKAPSIFVYDSALISAGNRARS